MPISHGKTVQLFWTHSDGRTVTDWCLPAIQNHPQADARIPVAQALYSSVVGKKSQAWIFGSVRAAKEVTRNLTRALEESSSARSLMQTIAAFAGSHIVILQIHGNVWVRGNATGSVLASYHVTEDGLLLSNRSDVLAERSGSSYNLLALAANLLEPVGHPFDAIPLWSGVETIPPGHMLHLKEDGSISTEPWWSPPDLLGSREEGSGAIGKAIVDSLRDLTPAGSSVLSDLSGGLDSTAITALLSTDPDVRHTDTVTVGDFGANEDERWALEAASILDIREHRVLKVSELPTVLSGIAEATVRTERPTIAIANHKTAEAMARLAHSLGATAHLTGHGGDHLFFGHPTLLADTFGRHPITTLRNLRAYAGIFDWPKLRSLKQLAYGGTFEAWLRSATTPGQNVTIRDPILGWGLPLRVPAWLHPDFIQQLNAWSRQIDPSPLLELRGAHAELDALRQGAALARGINQISGWYGSAQLTPFFDDRVMNAMLGIRPVDRLSPWEYKPLLKDALRGLVPDRLLMRRTKDEGSREVEEGLRGNHANVRAYLSETELARLGLIDSDALAQTLRTASHPQLDDGAILPTIAVESWLRSRQ